MNAAVSFLHDFILFYFLGLSESEEGEYYEAGKQSSVYVHIHHRHKSKTVYEKK